MLNLRRFEEAAQFGMTNVSLNEHKPGYFLFLKSILHLIKHLNIAKQTAIIATHGTITWAYHIIVLRHRNSYCPLY